ncbi:hypothetical protein [Deinococcus aestuarii]|uniref:hypothetical protein n=1 Tax=Deinococcus aestuarii TaxID=2774531 RepID=UPI001C0B643D|nr:hypothetical protein [Deinococcus aestuarii]
MLASELARELDVDPSVISKRLNIYHAEMGTARPRLMNDQTVTHMREAHALLTSGKAGNFKQAIQQLLGRYTAPIPSESAQELLRRMDSLEANQTQLVERMEQIIEGLRKILAKRDGVEGGN